MIRNDSGLLKEKVLFLWVGNSIGICLRNLQHDEEFGENWILWSCCKKFCHTSVSYATVVQDPTVSLVVAAIACWMKETWQSVKQAVATTTRGLRGQHLKAQLLKILELCTRFPWSLLQQQTWQSVKQPVATTTRGLQGQHLKAQLLKILELCTPFPLVVTATACSMKETWQSVKQAVATTTRGLQGAAC